MTGAPGRKGLMSDSEELRRLVMAMAMRLGNLEHRVSLIDSLVRPDHVKLEDLQLAAGRIAQELEKVKLSR